ncbi:MAG: methyltransferase domain-containing protein, partial [Elusimicrobia bacterium]|nr:methyltransferase domain-containing protein [Elusimicrobiota bacterium]
LKTNQARGPQIIMTQTALEHGAIKRDAVQGKRLAQEILKQTNNAKHIPAYFDDKDHFNRFYVTITARGPEFSTSFAITAQSRYQTIAPSIPIPLDESQALPYPLILTDLDGTLVKTLKPVPNQILFQLSQLLKAGVHIAIVTAQSRSELDKYLLNPLFETLKGNNLPFHILENLHLYPSLAAQSYHFSEDGTSVSLERDLAKDVMSQEEQFGWKKLVQSLLPNGIEFVDRDSNATVHGIKADQREPFIEKLNKALQENRFPVEAFRGASKGTIHFIVKGAGKHLAQKEMLGKLGLDAVKDAYKILVLGDQFAINNPATDRGLILAGARNVSVGKKMVGDPTGWEGTRVLLDEIISQTREFNSKQPVKKDSKWKRFGLMVIMGSLGAVGMGFGGGSAGGGGRGGAEGFNPKKPIKKRDPVSQAQRILDQIEKHKGLSVAKQRASLKALQKVVVQERFLKNVKPPLMRRIVRNMIPYLSHEEFVEVGKGILYRTYNDLFEEAEKILNSIVLKGPRAVSDRMIQILMQVILSPSREISERVTTAQYMLLVLIEEILFYRRDLKTLVVSELIKLQAERKRILRGKKQTGSLPSALLRFKVLIESKEQMLLDLVQDELQHIKVWMTEHKRFSKGTDPLGDFMISLVILQAWYLFLSEVSYLKENLGVRDSSFAKLLIDSDIEETRVVFRLAAQKLYDVFLFSDGVVSESIVSIFAQEKPEVENFSPIFQDITASALFLVIGIKNRLLHDWRMLSLKDNELSDLEANELHKFLIQFLKDAVLYYSTVFFHDLRCVQLVRDMRREIKNSLQMIPWEKYFLSLTRPLRALIKRLAPDQQLILQDSLEELYLSMGSDYVSWEEVNIVHGLLPDDSSRASFYLLIPELIQLVKEDQSLFRDILESAEVQSPDTILKYLKEDVPQMLLETYGDTDKFKRIIWGRLYNISSSLPQDENLGGLLFWLRDWILPKYLKTTLSPLQYRKNAWWFESSLFYIYGAPLYFLFVSLKFYVTGTFNLDFNEYQNLVWAFFFAGHIFDLFLNIFRAKRERAPPLNIVFAGIISALNIFLIPYFHLHPIIAVVCSFLSHYIVNRLIKYLFPSIYQAYLRRSWQPYNLEQIKQIMERAYHDFDLTAARLLDDYDRSINDKNYTVEYFLEDYPPPHPEPIQELRDALESLLLIADQAQTNAQIGEFVKTLAGKLLRDRYPAYDQGMLSSQKLPHSGSRKPYLDLATGTNFIMFVKHLKKDLKYILVDQSLFASTYLERLRKLSGKKNIQVLKEDILSLKFPSESLGAVRAKNVWSYVQLPKDYWNRVSEWIEPGGILVIQDDPYPSRRLEVGLGLFLKLYFEFVVRKGWDVELKLGRNHGHPSNSPLDTLILKKPLNGRVVEKRNFISVVLHLFSLIKGAARTRQTLRSSSVFQKVLKVMRNTSFVVLSLLGVVGMTGGGGSLKSDLDFIGDKGSADILPPEDDRGKAVVLPSDLSKIQDQSTLFSLSNHTGVLSVPYEEHAKAVKKVVNPNDDSSLVGLYAGAGADFSSFLLSTNVERAYFVSQEWINPLKLSRAIEDYWETISFTDKYSEYKKENGYSLFDRMGDIHKRIVQELKGLGVRKETIEVTDVEGNTTISFLWTYPGTNVERRYSITYIKKDITKISKPGTLNTNSLLYKVLDQGIDIYYQRAGMQIELNYFKFLWRVGFALKLGGYVISDDFLDDGELYYSHGGTKVEDVKFSPYIITDLIQSWVQFIKRYKGLGSEYGWNMKIYKKEKDLNLSKAEKGKLIQQLIHILEKEESLDKKSLTNIFVLGLGALLAFTALGFLPIPMQAAPLLTNASLGFDPLIYWFNWADRYLLSNSFLSAAFIITPLLTVIRRREPGSSSSFFNDLRLAPYDQEAQERINRKLHDEEAQEHIHHKLYDDEDQDRISQRWIDVEISYLPLDIRMLDLSDVKKNQTVQSRLQLELDRVTRGDGILALTANCEPIKLLEEIRETIGSDQFALLVEAMEQNKIFTVVDSEAPDKKIRMDVVIGQMNELGLSGFVEVLTNDHSRFILSLGTMNLVTIIELLYNTMGRSWISHIQFEEHLEKERQLNARVKSSA